MAQTPLWIVHTINGEALSLRPSRLTPVSMGQNGNPQHLTAGVAADFAAALAGHVSDKVAGDSLSREVHPCQ